MKKSTVFNVVFLVSAILAMLLVSLIISKSKEGLKKELRGDARFIVNDAFGWREVIQMGFDSDSEIHFVIFSVSGQRDDKSSHRIAWLASFDDWTKQTCFRKNPNTGRREVYVIRRFLAYSPPNEHYFCLRDTRSLQ